ATVSIVIGVVAAAITSLSFFIMIERRTYSALIDLKMLLDKILLPANIINMVVGITSLMVVYQTIPILIRSPPPLGFGGDALSIANVQLPYMVVSLIVSIASGFIVSKFGNQLPTVLGIILSLAGSQASIITFMGSQLIRLIPTLLLYQHLNQLGKHIPLNTPIH
ncbi:MAG: hypothetical protein WBE68_25660, partial [Candidatus Nitrosopolaris sp.]